MIVSCADTLWLNGTVRWRGSVQPKGRDSSKALLTPNLTLLTPNFTTPHHTTTPNCAADRDLDAPEAVPTGPTVSCCQSCNALHKAAASRRIYLLHQSCWRKPAAPAAAGSSCD